jgi:hypothetical protein
MKFTICEAYMSQDQKALLAGPVKAICKKYGVKGTLGVRHHSTIVLTIKEGKIDFIGEAIAARTNPERSMDRTHQDKEIEHLKKTKYIQVNPYWYHEHFVGKSLKFFNEIFDVLNRGNHDNSDIQTDYFDVGWYVDVNIGKWDKPYIYTGK